MHIEEVEYCSVGDARGIGASAHYLRLGRWGVLLDAGYDPHALGNDGLPDYPLLDAHPVNAIFVSHAHLDHIGSLPIALRHFPAARVYMTPATAELTDLMLRHYLRVQQRRGVSREQLPYQDDFLEAIHYLYQSFDYEMPFPLHGYLDSKLSFRFYDAGHILGSAGVLVEHRGKRIFYVGNTRKSAQFLLPGARYPEPPIDLLITESTYGADAEAGSRSQNHEVRRFTAQLNEVLGLGGIAVLPVFALGRTQEMMALIHRLRIRGQIPAVPLYVAGMGLKINKTYDRLLRHSYPEMRHIPLQAMTFGTWRRGVKLRGPAVLLATSGMMLPGTYSFELARKLSADPRNALFFVGYADPQTPAGQLRARRSEEMATALGLEAFHCRVEVFHFSAHSTREELMNMIERMKPQKIVFTHGDEAALQWMLHETTRKLTAVQGLIPQRGEWHRFLL